MSEILCMDDNKCIFLVLFTCVQRDKQWGISAHTAISTCHELVMCEYADCQSESLFGVEREDDVRAPRIASSDSFQHPSESNNNGVLDQSKASVKNLHF